MQDAEARLSFGILDNKIKPCEGLEKADTHTDVETHEHPQILI